jgi:hypothetical protein
LGKIGQLRTPRPSWCTIFGSGMLILILSQSMACRISSFKTRWTFVATEA